MPLLEGIHILMLFIQIKLTEILTLVVNTFLLVVLFGVSVSINMSVFGQGDSSMYPFLIYNFQLHALMYSKHNQFYLKNMLVSSSSDHSPLMTSLSAHTMQNSLQEQLINFILSLVSLHTNLDSCLWDLFVSKLSLSLLACVHMASLCKVHTDCKLLLAADEQYMVTAFDFLLKDYSRNYLHNHCV